MRPRMMYIEAAKRAGATRMSSDCMMKGPSAQTSLCERERPIKPVTSTSLKVSLCQETAGHCTAVIRTNTSNNKWDEIPRLLPDKLKYVRKCRQAERDYENDCGNVRRSVSIQNVCIWVIERRMGRITGHGGVLPSFVVDEVRLLIESRRKCRSFGECIVYLQTFVLLL